MQGFWVLILLALTRPGHSGVVDKILQRSKNVMKVLLEIETCGAPKIANIMENRTAKPGDQITFNCKVDMSCMVSTINWYHEFENGTEIQIKRPGDRGQPDIHIINSVSPVD
jgi:hypothetical protein